jgi:hypothetical protein
MEKKSLFQQQVSGFLIDLFSDGSVSIQKDGKLIGQGTLDSVVLTQWGEAHLDGCNARLGKDPEDTEEIYDQIDDVLSLAIHENKELASQLFLPRNKKQLELIAENWLDQLTPTEKQELAQNRVDPLQQKLQKAEFLSPEQVQAVIAKLGVLLREA